MTTCGIFFVFNDLRLEVVVFYVDIVGIFFTIYQFLPIHENLTPMEINETTVYVMNYNIYLVVT
jgi:hypothetical protein